MIASLVAAHTATPSISLAQNIAEATKTKVCRIFESNKSQKLISTYETQLQDGTIICAEVLRTDDQKMLELILHRKEKSGDITRFGGSEYNEDNLYLLPNPMDSFQGFKSYIGITCNSSTSCKTGETFIAEIEEKSQSLLLSIGKYLKSNDESLYFIPTELRDGITLKKTR